MKRSLKSTVQKIGSGVRFPSIVRQADDLSKMKGITYIITLAVKNAMGRLLAVRLQLFWRWPRVLRLHHGWQRLWRLAPLGLQFFCSLFATTSAHCDSGKNLIEGPLERLVFLLRSAHAINFLYGSYGLSVVSCTTSAIRSFNSCPLRFSRYAHSSTYFRKCFLLIWW